ncbi:MAG: hypothetical protein KDE33_05395 [Bacteroidetes bacterium]|nr:hypothetical protein [Bacteroidota bacterium]
MSKVAKLEKYIQSLDGYKIKNTHFKIGAKIHSTDFYYAKRLFQNSYYTARIAMLLTIKIKEKLNDKQHPITIVGYEMYSELLLSLIKKFLSEFGYSKINHCVTTDIDGEIKYFPNNVSFYDKIVIVVPITSTGSTTNKIVENIKKKNTETTNEFIPFTVLQSYDENFKSLILKQNTLITLKTKWQEPSNCEWCFNNNSSKPLFETDKSSLTPTLIFDLPSAKQVDADSLSISFDDVNFTNAIIYRRIKRNNEHFLFSTNTNSFLDSNRTQINKWLEDIKSKLNIKPTDKIVIISPCHYSNSQFINLVNDNLFHSSATIIHHQTDVDYLANFKLLNETFLKQKNTKMFFVDDSLISGKSFFSIYDLYRYTTNYEENLSGAIFLSNKSSIDIHTRVSRASKNVYSFVNINLPTHPKIFDKKPLEHEVKRYDELSKKALHDAIKKHFIDKSKDVNGEAIKKHGKITEQRDEDSEKIKRHINMFRATHKAYEYFQNHRNIDKVSFDDLLKDCGFDEKEIEDKMTMLKVLSQYPFLLYKPVREKTFEWHKLWINRVKDEHKKLLDNNTFAYKQFRELKFLIRRAVFLGNYNILEQDFFTLLQQVFKKISERTNKQKESSDLFDAVTIVDAPLTESEESNLNDFHIFLLQQYVELFHQNGWSSNKIIENISTIEKGFSTPQGKQFIRMLKIEAATVLNDFYTLLNDKKEWRKLYKSTGDTAATINVENKKITEFLENQKPVILETNKFNLSNSVLGLTDESNYLKGQFINYLWLKQFLNTDIKSNASKIYLTDKTEVIFQKLKGLFEEKAGAFFVVNDGKDVPHLVYDQDSSGSMFLNELQEDKHRLIFHFMKGVEVSYVDKNDHKEAKKTIIEYECSDEENNQWTDSYKLNRETQHEQFTTGCQWVLMIRISDSDFKTLGIIGFYGNRELQNNLLAKQLLMLLRTDIGAFIKRHHKNDEFSALREAEAVKRFAYLAGHGRQMIQKLAQKDNDTFGDVVATMEKLQYLFATKLIIPKGYSDETKKDSDKTLFNNIFSTQKVEKTDFNKIITIGNKIYETPIIENQVDIQEKLQEINNELEFNLNNDILAFICFELFVNAKKNRFHFISETCQTCNTEKNNLDIKFSVNEKLTVSLSGTGTKISDEVMNKINCGEAVKTDHEIAGLNLINKVIRILNPKNNLSIESKESKSCCGIYENTIKVEFNPMT